LRKKKKNEKNFGKLALKKTLISSLKEGLHFKKAEKRA